MLTQKKEGGKLTLHFQVSRTFGISSSEHDLAGLRYSAVVQDQSMFGTVLHDFNILQMANKRFQQNCESERNVMRTQLRFISTSVSTSRFK